MKNIKKENSILYSKKFQLFLILLSCFVSLLFMMGKEILFGHDIEYHLSRIIGISESLKHGDFRGLIHYPGFYGYGYANGLFYSNLFLYLPALLYLIGFHIITSYKIFIILCTIATAFSMYYCVNRVTKSSFAAMISSILYTLSAYRIVDVMVRAATGEILSFIFIPIVILGLYELIFGDYKKWYIFTLGFVFLVNCHLISCVLMFIIAICILLFCFPYFLEDKKRIKYVVLSGFVGLSLAAFFIIPMLEQYLSSHLRINTMPNEITSIVPFSKMFVGLIHYRGDFFPCGIGMVFIFIVIAWLRLVINHEVDKKDSIHHFVSLSIIVGIFTLISSTDAVPWEELSKFFGFIQFTWRLYIFSIAFLSFIGGYVMEKYFKNVKYKNIYYFSIITYLFLLCIANQILGFESLKGDSMYLTDYHDFFVAAAEYLPSATDRELMSSDQRVPRTNNDDLKIKYKEKDGKYYITFSNNTKEDTYIDIPYIYYLGYTVKSNHNQSYPITYGYNTWIRISIGSIKKDSIIIRYSGTKITNLSYIISIFSWILFLFFLFSKKDLLIRIRSSKR